MQLPSLSNMIARLKNEFFPTMCSCPKKSSRFFGLNLSAKGASFFVSEANKQKAA